MPKRSALFGLILATSPLMAATPSFNCMGTLTPVEKTICNSQEIATYDSEMAKLFRSARTKGVSGLVQDQKKWIGDRNQCERNRDVGVCVEGVYRERIRYLVKVWLDKHQEDYGPSEPIFSLLDEMVRGEEVIYLIQEFQYIYGSLISQYWMARFDGGMRNSALVCRSVVSEDGEFQEGDRGCDDARAKKEFRNGA